VPAGVLSITVDAYGAQGGLSGGSSFLSAAGGDGAHANGTLPVTPGSTLEVLVGGTGTRGSEAGGFTASELAHEASQAVAQRWAELVGEERYAVFQEVLREIVAANAAP
jgi:hypothetical protein